MKVESAICQVSDSFVNGTNDCEAHPKRWIAALVQMNCEKKVAAKLESDNLTFDKECIDQVTYNPTGYPRMRDNESVEEREEGEEEI